MVLGDGLGIPKSVNQGRARPLRYQLDGSYATDWTVGWRAGLLPFDQKSVAETNDGVEQFAELFWSVGELLLASPCAPAALRDGGVAIQA